MELPTRPVLTIAAAKGVAAAAQAHARSIGHDALIVAIVDPGGHLLYLERMDGIAPGTVDVAVLKARCTSLFESASKNFEDAVTEGLIGLVGLPGMAAFEGAVPILHDGWVVGAIAISGITKEIDGEIAQAAADALPAILAADPPG